MSCPHGRSDAAYVLGALSPAERTQFQTHLTECGACATAISELAPLPGLLSRVDPAVFLPPVPESRRLTKLLVAVAAHRRRQSRARRFQLVGAVLGTALLVAVGITVGWALLSSGSTLRSPGAAPAAMAPVAAGIPVAAEVAVAPVDGGTEVWMSCHYPSREYVSSPRVFWLVAVAADGSDEPLGSWWATPGDELTLTALTHLTDDLARVELRSASGAALLTYDVP